MFLVLFIAEDLHTCVICSCSSKHWVRGLIKSFSCDVCYFYGHSLGNHAPRPPDTISIGCLHSSLRYCSASRSSTHPCYSPYIFLSRWLSQLCCLCSQGTGGSVWIYSFSSVIASTRKKIPHCPWSSLPQSALDSCWLPGTTPLLVIHQHQIRYA